jgi:hypothetical protein
VVNTVCPDLGNQPRAGQRVPVPSVGAASGILTCSPPLGPAPSCRGSGGGKSGSAASASGATSAGTGPSGAGGSGAAAAEAGAAAVPGSSWSRTALAALVTSTTSLSKWARAGSSSNRKKTYSVDFFVVAFFTCQARRGTPVADGEAWSADGGVPATVIVTAAAAKGPAPTTSGSVPGGRAGRLQGDAVSTQHH